METTLKLKILNLREFIGNIKETPVTGNAIQDSNGSYLYSLQRIIDDNRIKLLKIHNNGIIGISRNLGVENSTGECLAFLDSDDWWDPSKLEVCLEYLNNGANVVYHDLYRVKKINQFLNFSKLKTRSMSPPIFDDLILNGWA